MNSKIIKFYLTPYILMPKIGNKPIIPGKWVWLICKRRLQTIDNGQHCQPGGAIHFRAKEPGIPF